jgi:hypothetical protein
MLFVVGAAVGLTALRNANVFWASATATVVMLAVATSLVGALTLRGREQSAWVGFAVFTVAYLAVAVGTVLSDQFKYYFGPTVAFEYVRLKVSGDIIDPWLLQREGLLRELMALQQSTDYESLQQGTALKAKFEWIDAQSQQWQARRDSADRWHSWLPGATNPNEFRCVGHSLCALLSGLIGTLVGRIFYARRERREGRTS